jgi:hypothetical protein
MKRIAYIFLIFSLSRCFTPDAYLPKIDSEKISLTMNNDQPSTFIKLGYPTSTLSKQKNNWQLKFENSTGEWKIYTNPNQPIRIFNSNINQYDLINNQSINGNPIWKYDEIKNNHIKSSIGSWGDFNFPNPESYKDVYILNWKQDSLEYYFKFQLLDASSNNYHIKYGPLDGTTIYVDSIVKDDVQLYSYFSLANNKKINSIEPLTDDWHIHLNYQVDSISKHSKIPYSSTTTENMGLFPNVELNHKHVEIHIDSLLNYEQINYISAKNLLYEKSKSNIGLFYLKDPTTNEMSINTKQNLIVRSLEEYFALRAINVTGNSVNNYTVTLEIKKL